jgi:hypothetical protein
MTPLEDAMTTVPDTATREEAREAMGLLQTEVERLESLLEAERAKTAHLSVSLRKAEEDIHRMSGGADVTWTVHRYCESCKALTMHQEKYRQELATSDRERLRRFEEREPLVDEILECFDMDAEYPQIAQDCGDGYRAGSAAKAVRDFDLKGNGP